jgi:hypothetical protein
MPAEYRGKPRYFAAKQVCEKGLIYMVRILFVCRSSLFIFA